MKRKSVLLNLSLVFLVMFCMAFACGDSNDQDYTQNPASSDDTTTTTSQTDSQTDTAQGMGAPYGARDPRNCSDMTSPASGAISSAQATKYIICIKEDITSDQLWLVENMHVSVGSGRPFNVNGDSLLTNADPRFPVYPVTGSFDSYQCDKVSTYMQNAGKNCTFETNPKAGGMCWKTTHGDWDCTLDDISGNERRKFNVPPPQ